MRLTAQARKLKGSKIGTRMFFMLVKQKKAIVGACERRKASAMYGLEDGVDKLEGPRARIVVELGRILRAPLRVAAARCSRWRGGGRADHVAGQKAGGMQAHKKVFSARSPTFVIAPWRSAKNNIMVSLL